MTDLASETAQSSGPAVADATPAVLEGRYALGELVGVGASAWVYRAEDLRTGRDVAVKLYPPGVGGTDRVRQRSELALLAQLHHPNLVVLFDAGEESGRAYLVMEFVDGATLAEQLREGPMQAGEVSRLGAELGYALAYVHSRGITHRDVKPANVLMGGRPMLTDFGIARLVDAARVTQTGYLIGTPAYLAPEQVSGDPVGMPADVYALGLVLLEALTGRRAFDGDGPEAAFARLSRQPEVPEDLPGLSELLREMTALDPADRPTAGQVSERLRASASGLDEVPVMLPLLAGSEQPPSVDLPPASERPSASSWRDQPFSDTDRRSSGPARPTGDSGTKVLPMPPAPVVPAQRALRSMPLPPGPALAAGRQRRQRRLLAGALGVTGLAAAVIGMVTAQGAPGPAAVPVATPPVAAAPAVPPMAPLQAVQPVTPDSGGSSSDSGSWDSGDSSSHQASQDSKKAKQEAKKAKEAQKKAQEKASSSDSSGDSSSN